MKKLFALLLVLVMLLSLAACGDKGESEPSGGSTAPAEPAPAEPDGELSLIHI